MRARILDAAVRVLRDEGALGFTTTRVADEAGISVGSLYQYFPNKHALVLAVHDVDIRPGWTEIRALLADPSRSARQKVIDITRWYFATESAQAQSLGTVFDDIDVFLRHRAKDGLDDEGLLHFAEFIAATSPARQAQADFDAEVLMTTIEAIGKAIANRPLSPLERERWAGAVASMLCEHLEIGD